MKFLVTGGLGFIGSHVAEALLARGDGVRIYDNGSNGRLENIAAAHGNVEVIIGDVRDAALLEHATQGCDGVFHLASVVGVKKVLADPAETVLVTIAGTANVLRAAAGSSTVVFTSSSEIYGKSRDVPFEELSGDRLYGSVRRHRWIYGEAKALAEQLVLAARGDGRAAVIARLFNTIGPRQSDRYGNVVPTFIRQATRGEPLTVYGSGQQSRCFLNVKDTARALLALMDGDIGDPPIVNVGSSAEISILELARRVIAITASASEIMHVSYERAYDPGFEEVVSRIPDLTRLRAAIGFAPCYDLDDTLRMILASQQAAVPASRA
jgi:UDP-glucose 4-epimerase